MRCGGILGLEFKDFTPENNLQVCGEADCGGTQDCRTTADQTSSLDACGWACTNEKFACFIGLRW